MGRPKWAADGRLVYHVLNRANARMPIFEKDGDDEAFEEILAEAVKRTRRGCEATAFCGIIGTWLFGLAKMVNSRGLLAG